MKYHIETTPKFDKQLKKLGHNPAKLIVKWLIDNIEDTTNPKTHGKALKHELKEYWRYRIRNYRVLAKIENDKAVVLAVEVGHRKDVYK